ncbi:MAG: HyaD/HybD family hydrogenase maturation endopeptidase [Acidobacteriota bacterium]|nr:HyaD/HybD family hydrogenase maturation endopeptidase [Acidobacteriota bacterium]
MAEPGADRLLILGLGNVLCGDDGLGVAAVMELERRYRLPATVRALDGGTLGLALMSVFERSEDAILVDAVQVDRPPGSLVRIEGEAVAPAVRNRLSVHQIGVADLLEGLRLVDAYPPTLVLLGLVPQSLELTLESSPPVRRNLPKLVEGIAQEARRLGHSLEPRDAHDLPATGFYRAAAGVSGM